jgi:hypothetical protein
LEEEEEEDSVFCALLSVLMRPVLLSSTQFLQSFFLFAAIDPRVNDDDAFVRS